MKVVDNKTRLAGNYCFAKVQGLEHGETMHNVDKIADFPHPKLIAFPAPKRNDLGAFAELGFQISKITRIK